MGQIKELEKEPYAYIGNHSHSHDYLVDFKKNDFVKLRAECIFY